MSKIGAITQFAKATWFFSVADLRAEGAPNPQTGLCPVEENRLASRFIPTVIRGNGKAIFATASGKAARPGKYGGYR